MTEVGFIIPTFCKNEENLKVCKFCIDSIRKFYPNNKIIIINDFSLIDITNLFNNDKNIDIIMSTQKGAADITTYDYFLKNKPFDIAVIMNDSMFFENKIENIDKVDTYIPLWHATNHRIEWDSLIVPKTQIPELYQNEITTHSENIITHIKKILGNTEFTEYALNLYKEKNKWSVNFCLSSIISHNFLIELQRKTNILSLLSELHTNWQRRVSESVFSIACQYILGNEINEKSINGLFYSGPRHLGGNGMPSNILHGYPIPYKELNKYKYYAKGKYTSKISLNRRR